MSTARQNYRSLPLSERIELVEDIWDSIAEDAGAQMDLSADQRAELLRRLGAHRSDPASGLAWEQVRMALFKQGS